MVKGLGWLRKRGAQAEVGAEATEDKQGEVRAIEVEAGIEEARIEEARRKQEGRDLRLQMKRVGAVRMISSGMKQSKGKKMSNKTLNKLSYLQIAL